MTTGQSAASRVSRSWSFSQWPLRRKLAAALIFPVLLAFALGGLRVKSDVDQAQQFARAADLTVLLRPVVEYNLAVQRLAASKALGGDGLPNATKAYDTAAAAVTKALAGADVSDEVRNQVGSALGLGKAVRVATAQQGAGSVAMDKSATTSTLVSTTVGGIGLNDVSSVQTLVAMQDAIAAQRAMTAQQLNLANTDDASGGLAAIEQVGAEASFVSRLKEQASAESGTYVRQLINENDRRGLFLQGGTLDEASRQLVADGYQRSNVAYAGLFDRQLTDLENALRASASEHRSQAFVSSALVIAALLAALVIVIALLRSLLTPIQVLRQGALDVARNKLPDAVRRIRDGEEPPKAEPIPIHTTEEMGQLARAVDDLHEQALVLAGEQARLRVQVGSMFETLSRRSTSLIDQQLTLIERLERDEEDPQRLQSLFRLDHLAARMRRNSDSLLVLAGTSTRRGLSGSVSVSDAVQAAVSEVENYQRIDIGETSDDQVLASVGSDLIHMIAEVVDNALAYSPPSSRVKIHGARTPDGGLLVEVRDAGLGMPPNELAALNERLADGTDITADTARRMGLLVVGSLAQRHGISVRLRRNGDADKNGITVSIHLPAHLLAGRPAAAKPAAGNRVAPTAPKAPQATPALPVPVAAVNGATVTPVADAPSKPLNGSSPAPAAGGAPTANGLPVRKPMATGITELTGGGAAPVRRTPQARDGAAAPGHRAAPAKDAAPAEDAAPATDSTPVADTPVAKAAAAADSAPAQPVAPTQDVTATPTVEDAPASSRDGGRRFGLPVRKPMATRITEHTGGPVTRPQESAATDEGAAEHRMPANLSAWLDHRAKLAEVRAKAEADAAATAEDATEGVSGVFEQASATADGVEFAAAEAEPARGGTEQTGGDVTQQKLEQGTQAWGEIPAGPDAPVEEGVTGLPRRQPGASGITPPAPAATGLPVRTPGASGVVAPAEPAHTPLTATGRSGATAYLGARRSREPESDADPAPAGAHEGEPTTDTVTAVVEETTIFRSMMSRWLSDPAEAAQDASTTWSPSTADEGWNAAARLEADEPLEESTAGLPLRRPGDHLVPGAIEDAVSEAEATTVPVRDPETIRRNLNSHHRGVRSARADALNGTHREEADVHH